MAFPFSLFLPSFLQSPVANPVPAPVDTHRAAFSKVFKPDFAALGNKPVPPVALHDAPTSEDHAPTQPDSIAVAQPVTTIAPTAGAGATVPSGTDGSVIRPIHPNFPPAFDLPPQDYVIALTTGGGSSIHPHFPPAFIKVPVLPQDTTLAPKTSGVGSIHPELAPPAFTGGSSIHPDFPPAFTPLQHGTVIVLTTGGGSSIHPDFPPAFTTQVTAVGVALADQPLIG